MKNLKPFTDYLLMNKISEEEGIKIIEGSKNLSDEEKEVVFRYCYPKPLLDYELPSRVQSYRTSKNFPMVGHSNPNLYEASLIIEAGRTQQYGRFIKHLINAFGDASKIAPLDGEDVCECPICGKQIFENKKWEEFNKQNNDTNREYLAFGSTDSTITMCWDCLIQLITAIDILDNIDPNFMDYKRETSNPWEKIKIK